MIAPLAALTAAVATYPWLGYPLLVRLLARLRGEQPHHEFAPDARPSVTVLCIAHNEAGLITAQAESVLNQDYPPELLSYLLVLDDSTDSTEADFRRVAERADGRFSVVRLPQRSGKAGGIAAAWPSLRSEIVVLTDANTAFSRSAVSALVAPFADPGVGAVAGVKRIASAADGRAHTEPEGIYWRYETWLKAQESAAGVSVAADGACWAVRRGDWDGRTPSARSDDLWGSTQVLRHGRRTVFTTDAEIAELAAPSVSAEFRRKRRTAMGVVLLVPHLGWLRAPQLRRHAWGFASHKLARLLTPWAIVAHVLVLAAGGRAWRLLAVLELTGAACTVLLALRPTLSLGPVTRPARSLGYVLIALTGWAIGTLEALRPGRTTTSHWTPPDRG